MGTNGHFPGVNTELEEGIRDFVSLSACVLFSKQSLPQDSLPIPPIPHKP